MAIPPPPVDASVVTHWLAIDGVQPEIPENRPIMKKRRRGNPEDGADSLDKQGPPHSMHYYSPLRFCDFNQNLKSSLNESLCRVCFVRS